MANLSFTSRWFSSLKEGLPPSFAFLYVYYNAISRRDIGQKIRIYNEAVAERFLELESAYNKGSKRGLYFKLKRLLIILMVQCRAKIFVNLQSSDSFKCC
jgi:hypothetical protein